MSRSSDSAPKQLTKFLAVAMGGGFGAVCRYAIQILVVQVAGIEAVSGWLVLLAINFLGCLGIGAVSYCVDKARTPVLHAAAIPGFLGGFTSFSAFVAFLFVEQDLLNVALQALTSVFVCVLGVAVARFACGRLGRVASRNDTPR